MNTPSPTLRKLNLGCGRKRIADAINVDLTSAVSPDVVHNLNCRPWPFLDDSFDEVLLYDVLEHLDDVLATMGEVHRIGRHGAIIRITTPHFSSANAFTDPTHRHFFGMQSFDCFMDGHQHSHYAACRFRSVTRQMFFHPSVVNKVVRRMANRWPTAYEQRWAWIFPAWFLSFDLEVVKT